MPGNKGKHRGGQKGKSQRGKTGTGPTKQEFGSEFFSEIGRQGEGRGVGQGRLGEP